VIDVGHADGILVRTPNGQWILIDAGQGTLLADSLPTQFGVPRLALAVGSHRHRDHIGGMDHVLNRIPADRYLGDATEYAGGADDDNLRDTLRVRSIPVQEPGPDTLTVDGVRVTVPSRAAFSMLFVRDAEVAERDWLAANHGALLDADVLKASHHGSDNGTSAAWLAAVTPERVVISAGVHGGFKHPHAGAVTAYEQEVGDDDWVYCTQSAWDDYDQRLSRWTHPRPPAADYEQAVRV
jgi:beta-lactamase superfamily II metal-dependent hydrolase